MHWLIICLNFFAVPGTSVFPSGQKVICSYTTSFAIVRFLKHAEFRNLALSFVNFINQVDKNRSLFNFFWFFFNFKTTTKFHPNLSKSIHSFKNVDSFTQAFTKIFQIVELFLWEFPTATAISHQV
ncbi:predicted protein [Methanosarcina acetivorans C2A]|uniref:Uncharacterized protein n=1 Tax=Methanosarcina acetivorans (strain ATCC 35395 / DSM 2834 / JCM 12185 / C2A) TaxID=188937 RepID=Q8TLC1_METAC|nr:predicted protein [Methanosarcina acetivorans C2A]